MSGFNLRQFALTELAAYLMQSLENLPEWQGPAKTDFDLKLRDIVRRLEEASSQLDMAVLAETAIETAAELVVVL